LKEVMDSSQGIFNTVSFIVGRNNDGEGKRIHIS